MFPSDQRNEVLVSANTSCEKRNDVTCCPCQETAASSRRNILLACADSKPFPACYGETLRAERGSRQGTTGLLSYLPHEYSQLFQGSSQCSRTRARGSQNVDTMDHRLMPLWTSSTRKLCLEPTSHLGHILAIGVAEFPGEIHFFTGNNPIADHHQYWHNQEEYPPRIHQERHPQVEQR